MSSDPIPMLSCGPSRGSRAGRESSRSSSAWRPASGKTYAMLKEARQKQVEGVDVVIGYLESHQRKETEELATGLRDHPAQELEYRGRILEEMDLDAVLARSPALVLVDELAHTNAPGARNRKALPGRAGADRPRHRRLHDGERPAPGELRGHGGGDHRHPVHERIPDSVFDAADQVVLIDISPEELLKRLAEGKVYLGDMARSAMENFFKKSTLTALREMALRHTALLVDHQLASYAQESGRESPRRSGERLLVAISPSPNSAHLIRWTRQRAFSLKAEWTALYVETGPPLGDSAQEALRKNMNLARQLGGRRGHHPVGRRRATPCCATRAPTTYPQIVLGKSGLSRAGRRLLRRPFGDGQDPRGERRHRRGRGPGKRHEGRPLAHAACPPG